MDTPQRPTFQPSIETQEILRHMVKKGFAPGTTYTREELMQAGSVDNEQLQGRMDTIQKALRRDHRVELGTLRGTGWVVLQEDEKPDKAGAITRSIYRRAKRGRTILAATDFSKLSAVKQLAHHAAATTMSMLLHVTRAPAQRQIADRVAAAQKRLPVDAALGALMNGKHNGQSEE